VLKFILLYGNNEGLDNVFVSPHSNGDGDCTVLTLNVFKEFLDAIDVLNVIKTRQCERIPGTAQIDFLQSTRNMEPLYLSETPFDEVLSGAFFCAGDIVHLLRHTETSIKCGLDFDGTTNMKFRDTWVAPDISGHMCVTKEFPFVHNVDSPHALNEGVAFQASCCWNGILTLRAKVFTDLGVRFRRSLDTECQATETHVTHARPQCKEAWHRVKREDLRKEDEFLIVAM
jgi:hypothetical protein